VRFFGRRSFDGGSLRRRASGASHPCWRHGRGLSVLGFGCRLGLSSLALAAESFGLLREAFGFASTLTPAPKGKRTVRIFWSGFLV